MGLNILDNGNKEKDQGKECKYGRMELLIKDIGKMIRLMEEDKKFFLTKAFIKVNLLMTFNVDKEFSITKIMTFIKDNLKTA